MSDGPADLAAAPRGRRRRARAFVANRSATQRIGVLAGLLILATAPFGGLRSAAEADIEPLALGQRLDLGAFSVTLDQVSQVTDLAPAITPEPGNRILVIKITVTNHSDRAELANQVAEAFAGSGTGNVGWADRSEPLRIVDVSDANEIAGGEYLNPGVTYEWALALQQRADVDLDTIELSVTGYHFREVDPQTLDPNIWVLDAQPLAEGHVPIVVVE